MARDVRIAAGLRLAGSLWLRRAGEWNRLGDRRDVGAIVGAIVVAVGVAALLPVLVQGSWKLSRRPRHVGAKAASSADVSAPAPRPRAARPRSLRAR